MCIIIYYLFSDGQNFFQAIYYDSILSADSDIALCHAVDSSDTVHLSPSHGQDKKGRRGIKFDGVTVFYFPRSQVMLFTIMYLPLGG